MGSRQDASGARGLSTRMPIPAGRNGSTQTQRSAMGIFDRPDEKKNDKNPKPDFSNVKSDSSSTAPSPGSAGTATSRIYVVKKGDSLSKIAKQIYGDANDWRRIFEANRDQIQDPDLIQPGQNLKIPA
jgi:nucleoid-associated protein YgaU